MSEEVKIKISQPMFEVGELERFDNNIHSIVEEYSKMMVKEKDQILTQRIIMKQEEEIEQLQNQLQQKENIIKEVREYISKVPTKKGTEAYRIGILEILDKEVISNE